jgi:dCMP deaminase
VTPEEAETFFEEDENLRDVLAAFDRGVKGVTARAPRPTWDETWMAVAKIMARRSQCSLSQVGSVIVTPDNRVNSTGYNGKPRNLPGEGPCENWCPRAAAPAAARDPAYLDCPGIHSEANNLLRADWTQIQRGTLYVNGASCLNCARLIANSGLARLVHVVAGKADLRRNPGKVEQFLRESGVEVLRWPG